VEAAGGRPSPGAGDGPRRPSVQRQATELCGYGCIPRAVLALLPEPWWMASPPLTADVRQRAASGAPGWYSLMGPADTWVAGDPAATGAV